MLHVRQLELELFPVQTDPCDVRVSEQTSYPIPRFWITNPETAWESSEYRRNFLAGARKLLEETTLPKVEWLNLNYQFVNPFEEKRTFESVESYQPTGWESSSDRVFFADLS